MTAFDVVCIVLAILYAIYAIICIIQLARISIRDTESVLSIGWICPQTVQQQAFLIVLLICLCRVAFFNTAIFAWDDSAGEVTKDKVEFYSLDEFATVFFFTLTCVLAMFWAELYYISIENISMFTYVVKPITYFLNLSALIAIAVCCYYVIDIDVSDDVDYIYIQFTIVIATVYIVAAIMFGYFAYAAALELKQIPIVLTARRDRMRILRMIAIIFIVALLVKAGLLIYLTGEVINTEETYVLVIMFFFYFLLELFPMATVLAFYQVDPLSVATGARESDSANEESRPLNPDTSNTVQRSSSSWSFSRPKPSSAEVIDNIIAKVSVDA